MLSQIETLLNVTSVLIVTFLVLMLGWKFWLLRRGSTIKAQFYLFLSLAYIAISIIEIGYSTIYQNEPISAICFASAPIFLYWAIDNMLTFKRELTKIQKTTKSKK